MGALNLKYLPRDIMASVVVFLVALPLCLGIALASGAPLAAGLLAGVIGGTLVGSLSGSRTSVSGPAAGLTAAVAGSIESLGSYNGFLTAVVLAGVIQVILGLAQAGFIASFFPSSVIEGLLAAIGIILILKQVPHLFGHDVDPEGEMSFVQPDGETTISELWATVFDVHPGAAIVGMCALGLLVAWGRLEFLKKSLVPAPLAAVVLGVAVSQLFSLIGPAWEIQPHHLVAVPAAGGVGGFVEMFQYPDWTFLRNPSLYTVAVMIAIVASLETLLNLDAVDKLDPQQRRSPPNRELVAQGVGNMVSGMVGGLPMTSVIIRGSVNINAGAKTKLSAILHGILIAVAVIAIPNVINLIPLSALAAILIVTGFKLASPSLFKRMWREGRLQFFPFIITVVMIVVTDLLTGVLLGLGMSLAFILYNHSRRPITRVVEHHVAGPVLRIDLGNQVTFFHRASLGDALDAVESDGHVLLDARTTDYIDPDIMHVIEEFRSTAAPARGITVSFVGFRDKYPQIADGISYVDYTSRDIQTSLTPQAVLDILAQGNGRFRTGQRLTRDLVRQVSATSSGQAPLATVLSCIDSRSPVELVFDLGIGDIFSIRLAGNVVSERVLGSLEYGCAVAGAKLVLVMGHTACGAVGASVDLLEAGRTAAEATGCDHLGTLVDEIQQSIPGHTIPKMSPTQRAAFVDDVAVRNVERMMGRIIHESRTIATLLEKGTIDVVGALYDVRSAAVTFLPKTGAEFLRTAQARESASS